MKQKGRSLIIFKAKEKNEQRNVREEWSVCAGLKLRGLKRGNVEDKRNSKLLVLNFLCTLFFIEFSPNPARFNLHQNGKVNKLWTKKC